MSEQAFDVIVIGAGPGGYPAAIRAAQLGLSTACIEKELLGGVCLNWGCIPSKALIKTAELAHKIRHADDFGLGVSELDIDFERVIDRSRGISKRFNKGVGGLFKKYGVTRVEGTARLLGGGQVQVTSASGEQVLTAKHIVVATGARARVFPSITPDGERIHTYRSAIVEKTKPTSAIVLGAGAIGMEFAYFWNAMGTDVTVVEGQNEVLPIEDREVGRELRRQFEKSGVSFKLDVFVDTVERTEDGNCRVTLQTGEVLEAHTVLAALGITPNTEDIGLDAAGVEVDRRGFVKVDTNHQTTAPGVYAVGDVCDAGPALAHTATRQAHVCIERIAGLHVPDVDYTNMPSCTYCQPQVASVGLTEEAAKAAGHTYSVGKFPFMANGRSQGAGAPEGFVKVLVDDTYGEIIGAHIIGSDATEMISEFVLARSSEATAELLMHTVHAHPTASEAMLEAVAASQGASVHI
ncbi:MAG: dihydrolipoyl dehydrogenase [Myxococcota bacterium]